MANLSEHRKTQHGEKNINVWLQFALSVISIAIAIGGDTHQE